MLHNSYHYNGKDTELFQRQLKLLKRAIEIAREDGLTSKLEKIEANMENAQTALELRNILHRNFMNDLINRAKKSVR